MALALGPATSAVPGTLGPRRPSTALVFVVEGRVEGMIIFRWGEDHVSAFVR